MCVISRDYGRTSDFSKNSAGRVIYQTAGSWQVVNGNFSVSPTAFGLNLREPFRKGLQLQAKQKNIKMLDSPRHDSVQDLGLPLQ